MDTHLRAWRKYAGRTLVDVGEYLRTSHTTVLRYERGEMKVPADVIDRLAELYGCTPSELQFHPDKRNLGRNIHDAIKILEEMNPDIAERWLEVGRLMRK